MSTTSASDAPVRPPGTRARSGNAMGRTRTALLAAASGCLERYGVRKTTMVDVAARSGVAKATLYNHFRTKDDLLAALVETAVADLVAACVQTATASGPVPALVQAVVELSVSGPLRKAAVDEPALVAPLLVPGDGRGWTVARDGVAAMLAAGHVAPRPGDVEVVLRWVLSHVAWPTTPEQAEQAAALLVYGIGRRSVTDPAVDGPVPATGPDPAANAVPAAAAPVGVGWPG